MFIYFLVFFLFCSLGQSRNKSPLMDEETTKMRNKSAECIFGKQVRELGSVWIPDLGPPIGVLYCMRCECVKMQRKRRIVAKVQCHNIKSECPEPTCDEPVLRPGRCCKTCNGDLTHPEIVQDIIPQSTTDEEERGAKHFAALLTGRSSLILKHDFIKLAPTEEIRNNVVATARFNFHRKNLFYSFYVSDKAARPYSLQFVDSEGNILEEITLSTFGGYVNSVYQNATRKICGVWRRLPKEYRRLLKQERMYVVLVWGIRNQAEFTISGQLKKYPSLNTELFSSLLEPAPGSDSSLMTGTGGTAIVYSTMSVSPSIHVAVIFNGLFTRDDISEVPINISLSVDEKRFVIQDTVYVHKPGYELNFVEISSPVLPADLRQLTRGRLLISVSSVSKPEALRLTGSVGPKVTCELFQTTLQSSPSDRTNIHGTSGLAWMYLNNEGALVYNVQVDNLRREPAQLTLIDVSTKRRTELEDLTPYFVSGWANGTIDKLSPKVLEPLYSGNLAVNIATETDSSFISGKLVGKLVADAKDAPTPILLKRENYTLPPSAVGMAWLIVDDDCLIHYDVSLSGLGGSERKYLLYMELLPMIAPGAPTISKLLEDYQGNQVDGSLIESLTRDELNWLVNGVCFLKVKDKDSRITLLSAQVPEVQVPPSCRPVYADNNVPHLYEDYAGVSITSDCFYEGIFYQDEAQWTSASDPCVSCYCQNGNSNCFRMPCLDLSCSNGQTTHVPNECCPVCSNVTAPPELNTDMPQKCILNGMTYSPGTKFHPFLIPTGFDTCTECTCDPIYLEIKCVRKNNEKGCCKNCHRYDINNTLPGDDPVINLINNVSPQKEVPMKTPEDIWAQGGCVNVNDPRRPYENGSTYHPVIESLGEYKCVTCKCQNHNQTCTRQHCDRQACERMFRMKSMRRRGQLTAPDDFCCSHKECRKYRLRQRRNRTSIK